MGEEPGFKAGIRSLRDGKQEMPGEIKDPRAGSVEAKRKGELRCAVFHGGFRSEAITLKKRRGDSLEREPVSTPSLRVIHGAGLPRRPRDPSKSHRRGTLWRTRNHYFPFPVFRNGNLEGRRERCFWDEFLFEGSSRLIIEWNQI